MGRTRDPRPLALKIRVVAPRGSTRAEVLAALDLVARGEPVPEGFTIRWLDWKKGTGGEAHEGVAIGEDVLYAFKAFYGAITHPSSHVRVEHVAD